MTLFRCSLLLATATAVLVSVRAGGQQAPVNLTGTVTSTVGQAIPYAQVTLTLAGQTTPLRLVQAKEDGRYIIQLTADQLQGQTAVLAARSLGFKAKASPITLRAPISPVDFALEPNPLQLGEVVVTGAGTTREVEKIANARSIVDTAALARSNEPNIAAALAAKAPGVNVTSNAGDPGASASVRIRGSNTIGHTSEPLYVVDGVPIDNSTNTVAALDAQTGGPQGGVASPNRAIDINPDDVASIEILKGAAAGAIYGARAGQGVILITTKSGRPGATTTTFRSQYGVSDVNKFPELQRQYGEGDAGLAYGCIVNKTPDCGTLTPLKGLTWGPLLTGGTPTYNHQSEVFQNGTYTDNTLGVSGGDRKTTFYASGSYTDQNGPIVGPHDYLRRTAVRLKAEHEVLPNVRINGNVQFANTNQDAAQKGYNFSSITWTSWLTPPDFNNQPAYVNGQQRSFRYPFPSAKANGLSRGYDNPFFSAFGNQSSTSTNRVVGSLGPSWQALPWLRFNYVLGVDYAHDNRIQGEPIGNSQTALPTGQVLSLTLDHFQLDHNLFGTASWSRGPNAQGTLTLGQNLNARSNQTTGIVGDGIFQNFQYSLNNTNGQRVPVFNAQDYVHNDGYFGQTTLDLAQQVFLKAGIRYDGSSTFDRHNQYAWFPNGSAAWEFSKLLGNGLSRVISFGKLRIAYGETGTEPLPYKTVRYYQASGNFTDFFSAANLAAQINGNAGLFTPDTQPGFLKPERTKELEGGIDLGLFGDRADLSATYYHKGSDNVILPLVVPASTGYTNQYVNGAKIRNNGVELSLNVRPIATKLFSWEVGATYAANWNLVTDLHGRQFTPYGGLGGFGFAFTQLGGSVNNINGYDYVRCGRGVVLTDASGTGTYNVDANCSASQRRSHALFIPDAGLASTNGGEGAGYPLIDSHQRPLAHPDPNWAGNVHTQMRIAHFSVSALLDIRQGGTVYDATRQTLDYYGTSIESGRLRNTSVIFGQSYMPGSVAGPGVGTKATLDQTWFQNYIGGILPQITTPYLEDGSFVKLREVSVAYTWDSRFVRHNLGLGSVELRVAGRNLLTSTNYRGADPEVNAGGAETGAQGIDYFGVPQTRSFVFTLSLTR